MRRKSDCSLARKKDENEEITLLFSLITEKEEGGSEFLEFFKGMKILVVQTFAKHRKFPP